MNQINKTLDDKNDEIAVLSTKYSDISKKNKESEFDLEDIRKIKEVMDIKLKNSYEEANRLEINKEELLNKINRLDNENKIMKNQIQSVKRNYAELEEKKIIEIDFLNKDIDTLKIKERDIGNKLIFMERDQDNNKEENRRLTQEVDIIIS